MGALKIIRDWYGKNAQWVAVPIFAFILALAAFFYGDSRGYQRANEYAAQSQWITPEERRDEQDLNAQREMADWAEGMIWTTGVVGALSILITGVGIIYVRKTLLATSEAVAAANEANRLAREALKREYQPFVMFTNLPGQELNSDSVYKPAEKITLLIKNYGRGPAYDVSWAFYHRIIDSPRHGANYRRIDTGFFAPFLDIMAPDHDVVVSFDLPLSGDDLKEISNGKLCFCQALIIHDHDSDFRRKEEAFFTIESDGRDGFRLVRIANGMVWTHEQWRNEQEVKAAIAATLDQANDGSGD